MSASVKPDRRHFNADGTHKAGMTRAQARRFESKVRGLKAYRCPVCGEWHAGTKRNGR